MIKLTRTIDVRSFDVEATVAVGRDRPEFLAIAQLAQALGGELRPEVLKKELFEPLPEHAARLAMERCVALRLLAWQDRHQATLTEFGRSAIETNQVLIPEQGIWRFQIIEDPLVPFPLVHLARLKTDSAFDEIKAFRKRSKEDVQPPPLLKEQIKRLPRGSLVDGQFFQLWELGARALAGPTSRLTLDLHWGEPPEDTPTIRLSGGLAEAGGSIDTALPSPDALSSWDYNKLWRTLITRATNVWEEDLARWHKRTEKYAVPLAFDEILQPSRRSFRQDFAIPKIELGDLGSFDPSVMEGVDIVPAMPTDAQAWLEWLQWENIGSYVVPAQIDDAAERLRALFPFHAPAPLTAYAIHEKALTSDHDEARRRFVLAPADLGLWS